MIEIFNFCGRRLLLSIPSCMLFHCISSQLFCSNCLFVVVLVYDSALFLFSLAVFFFLLFIKFAPSTPTSLPFPLTVTISFRLCYLKHLIVAWLVSFNICHFCKFCSLFNHIIYFSVLDMFALPIFYSFFSCSSSVFFHVGHTMRYIHYSDRSTLVFRNPDMQPKLPPCNLSLRTHPGRSQRLYVNHLHLFCGLSSTGQCHCKLTHKVLQRIVY